MARCLLVDDDAEIRASLQAYLEGFGHRVTYLRGVQVTETAAAS
jgi:CheY-like chemotaxis protein